MIDENIIPTEDATTASSTKTDKKKFNIYTLIQSIMQSIELFVDSTDHETIYARFTKANNVACFTKVDSADFKAFLRIESLRLGCEKCIDADVAIQYIRDLNNYNPILTPIDVHLRSAGTLSSGIEYDLLDDKQHTVLITRRGWQVNSTKKNNFLQSSMSLPQVIPRRDSSKSLMELLQPFVNIHGDDFIIFVIWLVQCFCCNHHYALLLKAERGSGKSTLSKLICALLDPSKIGVTVFPAKTDDLFALLANSYLICFDNVREISKNESDILCSAITGATVAKRSLYTTNSLTTVQLNNTVVINGIDVIPQESDLAERFTLVSLKKLKKNELMVESRFWADFNTKKPEILGAIFEALHKAMDIYPTINPVDIERMTDAFVDMLAISQALGVCEDDFRRIFDENSKRLQKERANTPVVDAVREYMNTVHPGKTKVENFSSVLYAAIRSSYSGSKNLLPGSAPHFTRKIDSEHEALLAAGFRINVDDTGSKGTKMTIIRTK